MELSDVLWVGGPAGAGKSTLARLLARRRGLRWYSSDTRTWVHRDRALAAGVELPDRGPGHGHYDRRRMVVDDLAALPASPLTVAEGGVLPPAMVRPANRGVWLIPTKEAQRARLAARHPDGVPPAYLRDWEVHARLLDEASVPTITVDRLTVAETVLEVERIFAPFLAGGPTAADLKERRSLIREGNLAIVTQYASPSSRPLVPVDPHRRVLSFDCECAASRCQALVDLTVSAAAAAVTRPAPAILAAGHRERSRDSGR